MLLPEDMRFSVAPMMDWTDRHCRMFHRSMSRRTRLYTEMVTTGAVMHGPRERLLGFSPQEQPLAVQLGGSDPQALAEVAQICASFGYGEINLNVGCPSDRVQNGSFGACLMAEPNLVAQCVSAMKKAVDLPITVKCRIGIDDQDPVVALNELADAVVAAGVDALIVHARMAWLKGLSPKDNRDIPPLDYPLVYRLKQRLPDLPIAINGGILDLRQAREHLRHVDGVMLGRAAYQNPGLLIDVDPLLFGEGAPVADGFAAIEAMEGYIEARLVEGSRLHAVTRHMLGLFQGLPGARAYRRHLAEEAIKPGASMETLRAAANHVREACDRRAVA
ncbi:MAG: tRNA dihydrouridine(20/20a) synthase DusA [Beijerinckiaceae bacterium]|nr:tRNA dihydrouridine(20/20a) synthase DusA [Beijerinckiaceae bacterium]